MVTLSISLWFIIHWSQSTLWQLINTISSMWHMIKKKNREHLQDLLVITWHGGEHNPELLMPCLWDHTASLNKIKMEFRNKKEWLCSDTSLSEISSGPPLNNAALLQVLWDPSYNWRRKRSSFGSHLYTKWSCASYQQQFSRWKNSHLTVYIASHVFAISTQFI